VNTDNNTIANRIRIAIEYRKKSSPITRTKVERESGMAQGELSTFLKRNSNRMRADKLNAIANILGVNVGWLEFGSGAMVGDKDITTPEPAIKRQVVVRDDVYQTRAPIVAMLEADGEEPALISALKAERCEGGDPGLKDSDYWLNRVSYYRRALERVRAERAMGIKKPPPQLEPDDPLGWVPGEGLR
jgi:transcriptional regulator with XRE-family HTH domain